MDELLPEISCRIYESVEVAHRYEEHYLYDLKVYFLTPSPWAGAVLAPEDGWIPAALAPIRQGWSSHGGACMWPLDCKLVLNFPVGPEEPEIIGVAVRYVRQLEGEANDPTEKALTPGQGS